MTLFGAFMVKTSLWLLHVVYGFDKKTWLIGTGQETKGYCTKGIQRHGDHACSKAARLNTSRNLLRGSVSPSTGQFSVEALPLQGSNECSAQRNV